MEMLDKRYFAKFSHQYEDGPSGPARSYFEIRYGLDLPALSNVKGQICLHHHDSGTNPQHWGDEICAMLNEARAAGRADKAEQFRSVLGI